MTNNILFRYFGGPLSIFSGPAEHELREARRLLGSGTPVDFTVNINNRIFILTVKVIIIGLRKRDKSIPLKLILVKSDLFGLPRDLQASYNPSYETGTIEALKTRTRKNPPA